MRFKDFISKIHPIPKPNPLVKITLPKALSFKVDRLGRPLDWSIVPIGTELVYFEDRWGTVTTRATQYRTFVTFTEYRSSERYPIRATYADGNTGVFDPSELRIADRYR